MKRYLVIGNPIDHSLSPLLHNYWIEKNKITEIYEKKLLKENEIKNIILKIRSKKIDGINVTVPFKNKVVNFMDTLTKGQANMFVNTIYFKDEKIVGHNTDIDGFELGIRSYGYDVKKKNFYFWRRGCSTQL